MLVKARFRGNTLILTEPVALVDGQEYIVDVRDQTALGADTSSDVGSAATFLNAMKSLPSIPLEWVDELEKSIEAGKQQADFRGVFDDLVEEPDRSK